MSVTKKTCAHAQLMILKHSTAVLDPLLEFVRELGRTSPSW